MSMLLMVKAMQVTVGNPLRKLVLIKLADNANDQGECWPSYQYIADCCEVSRETVKTHIRELEKMGLLRREFRRSGQVNQSNIFHLTLDGSVADPGQELTGGGSGADRGVGQELTPEPVTLEPVNEPVIKQIRSTAKKTAANHASDQLFESVWQQYPKREGSNPKNHALSAWNARIAEGRNPEDMIAGLQRYLSYCQARGQIGTAFVMQAKRFFGTSLEFANDWEVSQHQGRTDVGMVDPNDTSWIHGDWGY